MAVVDGRTWMEHLTPEECWQLLAESPVGRIGVIVDGRPEIYPVNYVVDGETLVFRTDAGNKLRGLGDHPGVCLEVDGIDTKELTGWSVLVKGRAIELHLGDDLARVEQLPLRNWARGEKGHWIEIQPREITGRRIYPPPER